MLKKILTFKIKSKKEGKNMATYKPCETMRDIPKICEFIQVYQNIWENTKKYGRGVLEVEDMEEELKDFFLEQYEKLDSTTNIDAEINKKIFDFYKENYKLSSADELKLFNEASEEDIIVISNDFYGKLSNIKNYSPYIFIQNGDTIYKIGIFVNKMYGYCMRIYDRIPINQIIKL